MARVRGEAGSGRVGDPSPGERPEGETPSVSEEWKVGPLHATSRPATVRLVPPTEGEVVVDQELKLHLLTPLQTSFSSLSVDRHPWDRVNDDSLPTSSGRLSVVLRRTLKQRRVRLHLSPWGAVRKLLKETPFVVKGVRE